MKNKILLVLLVSIYSIRGMGIVKSPTITQADVVNSSQVYLTWDTASCSTDPANSNYREYATQYKTEFNDGKTIFSSAWSTATYVKCRNYAWITNLPPNKTNEKYFFRVWERDSAKNVAYSLIWRFLTPADSTTIKNVGDYLLLNTSIKSDISNLLKSDSIFKSYVASDVVSELMNDDSFVQGLKGEKGDQGVQGIQGLQGIQGEQGPVGANGLQGLSGERGIQGEKGDPGIDGQPGTQGLRGEPGPSGPIGPQGIQGEGTLEDRTILLSYNYSPNYYQGAAALLTVPYNALDNQSYSNLISYSLLMYRGSYLVNLNHICEPFQFQESEQIIIKCKDSEFFKYMGYNPLPSDGKFVIRMVLRKLPASGVVSMPLNKNYDLFMDPDTQKIINFSSTGRNMVYFGIDSYSSGVLVARSSKYVLAYINKPIEEVALEDVSSSYFHTYSNNNIETTQTLVLGKSGPTSGSVDLNFPLFKVGNFSKSNENLNFEFKRMK